MIILSWNVNNDYRGIHARINQILDLISASNADVLGLQEIIPKVYDLLYNKLKNYYTISVKQNKSYFSMMISKFKCPIKICDFATTGMNREFLMQKTDEVSFISTHLESMPTNKYVRKLQADQISEQIRGPAIVFGDTNFTRSERVFQVFALYNSHDQKYLHI